MNDQQAQPRQQPSGSPKRKRILIAVVILVIAAAVIYWAMNRGKAVTDDAQVEGRLVPITARTSGYVRSIEVDDNELVGKGQALVELDRRDLTAKLQTFEAGLATQRAQAVAAERQVSLVGRTAPAGERLAAAAVTVARAGVDSARRRIVSAQAEVRSADAGVNVARAAVLTAESEVEAAKAQVDSAQAALDASQADVTSAEAQATKAANDAARYREMYASGAVPKQQLEAVEANNTTAQSALSSARDRVQSAKAALQQAAAHRAGAEAGLKQARGRLASAIAAADQARAGVALARAGLSQALGQLRQAEANQAAARTAPQQISISKANEKAAVARERQSAADVSAARLQLSYARIAAPVHGQVSQKTVQLGQYVQPGQVLMAVVPLDETWVVANFKETQIEHVRPGRPAEVEVDTYPGIVLKGRIESIAAATGAKFSLLPPENATGNFVKVVQRIPVKIVLDRPLPRGVVLRPGQNVIATVFL